MYEFYNADWEILRKGGTSLLPSQRENNVFGSLILVYYHICLDQVLQSVGITACGQVLLSFDLFSSGIQMQREDNGMQMECSILVGFDIS